MFTPKSFKEILNDMVGWVTLTTDQLTNFRVGSIIRTLLEAVAIELEQVYFQTKKLFRYGISEAIYTSFDFQKEPAKSSTGQVKLVFQTPLPRNLVLPKGFLFSTQPSNEQATLRFETPNEYVISTGATEAYVNVVCTTPGLVGNIESMAIKYCITPVLEISQVYNDLPFYDGADEESIEDRKRRFSMFIQTLTRGTLASVRYAVVKTEGVAGAYLYEKPGVIYVYAHDSLGQLPDELKQAITDSVHEYKSGGIQVVILPVTRKEIQVSVSILLRYGSNLEYYQKLVQDTVSAYINSMPVSRGVTNSELITKIMTIDNQSILSSSVLVNGSSSDLSILKNEILRTSAITVSVTESTQ